MKLNKKQISQETLKQIAKKHKSQRTINLTDENFKRFKAKCAEEGLYMGSIIDGWIADYLEGK